ncbi:MAG: LysM peptidoglycan-binding domain-containing protein [Chloroflexota bacterium]
MQRRRPLLSLLALASVAWLATACTLPGESAIAGSSSPPAGTPAPSPSASGPSRPFRPTPTPAPTFASYTVGRGDTLIALAGRFETTPESLAYWNRARYPSLDPESPAYRPDRIEVGWRLSYIPGAVVDPENLPPASGPPTDDPGAAASARLFPTLPPDGGAALVERGPAGLDGVALTFEFAGGPGEGPGGAAAIVQWLAANGVSATIFVAAAALDDPDGAAVVRRLAGSGPLVAGLLAPTDDAARLAAALRADDSALLPALGRSTAPWLRPAGGDPGADALLAAGTAGWRWAVSWDVDPDDGTAPGDGGPIATDIVARVVSRASGGSIIRLQLGGARTLDALPGLRAGLAAAGLRVVPLGDVLGVGGGEGGG